MSDETMKQTGIVIVVVLIFFGAIFAYMSWSGLNNDIHKSNSQVITKTIDANNLNLNIQTSFEKITIDAKKPEPRSSLPYYRAYYAPGDVEDKTFGDLHTQRYNLTSVEEAPELARKAMESYGGIPSDAYVSLSTINKAIIGDLQNPTEIRYFENQVYFSRTINGIPITGMDDGIIVWLGDNGELLRYKKFWRTLEKAGDVPVVSVDKAIQKLEKREMVNPPQNPSDATVNSINLRYYAKSWNEKEISLEPVYEFYAKLPNDHDYQFFVYARQFAAFDQSPAVTRKSVAGKTVSEEDPFTATFTDTSDANPTKWQWDFGDGTSSTEKNPTHHYNAAGTYNVTLTVWNELGSDTTVQQYTVNETPVKTTEPSTSVKITETPGNNNETPTAITSSPTGTAVTSRESIIPSATTLPITAIPGATTMVNAIETSPVPTVSLNVTPVTTTGNPTGT